jgi:hypothetical protein
MRLHLLMVATVLTAAAHAHDCVQPTFPAGRAPKAKIDAFNTQFKAYGECINQFIAQQNAVLGDKEKAIALLRAEANAAIDAGNAATAEYNAYARHIAELAAK